MAGSAFAQPVLNGLLHARHRACSRPRAASWRAEAAMFPSRGGQFKLRTCSNTFMRWTAPKPGRGGRLTVVGAHSAVPQAAGLFNPANDKVCDPCIYSPYLLSWSYLNALPAWISAMVVEWLIWQHQTGFAGCLRSGFCG